MSHLEKAELAAANPPPVSHTQPAYYRKLGNPGPLGLFGFASTTFILSLYNIQARGVTHPNVVVGMALFVGGLAQFVAGMWEFACQNTFGATAFTMYGGFWLSYATIFLPGSGVLEAYAGNADELNSALGIWLFTWFIITSLLLIASLRTNVGLIVLFFFLDITFLLLGSSHFIASEARSLAVEKAGGSLGIVTALVAFYVALAGLLADPVNSWFSLPIGPIPKGRVD